MVKKQFFSALCQHGRGLVLTTAVLSAVTVTNVADAQIIFEATTGNTTLFSNGRLDFGLATVTGATPDLILENDNGAFNNSGFASTDDINTLNGTALTAADTVTFSLVIDSIGAPGVLRGRGISFGMAAATSFAEIGTGLVLDIEGNAGFGGNDVLIGRGFQDELESAGFNIAQASIEDGFSFTLTANRAGYTFLLTDIVVSESIAPGITAGDTTASVSGIFAGTNFVDNFGVGHFYTSAQKWLGNADNPLDDTMLTMDYSVASIHVSGVGDFNLDGVVDCADLDGYVGNIGAAADVALVALDIDGNGTIEASDAIAHITTLIETSNGVVGTFPGDLNCDGAVTVLGDGFTLVGSLGNSVTTYSQGDIDFNGQVTVLADGFILIANLGNTNAQ